MPSKTWFILESISYDICCHTRQGHLVDICVFPNFFNRTLCFIHAWLSIEYWKAYYGPAYDLAQQRTQTSTLESGINVGARLLIFEKKLRQKKMKNDRNALIDAKMH